MIDFADCFIQIPAHSQSHQRSLIYLNGIIMRVKVWRIEPYISTNGQKVALVSYQIRRGDTQDLKDLPIIVFSPWNCDFLKLCVPQGAVLPGHGIFRHLGFK